MKRVILEITIFLFLFCFLISQKVLALQIKNINYSASNNNDRWVEIYNDGDDISDFTINSYKIIDSEDITNHSINQLLGDVTFPKNTSIYISPSTNVPDGAMKAFRSPYKLDKTNGYLILKSDDKQVCLSYGNGVCGDNSQDNNSTSSTSTDDNKDSSTNTTENIKYVYVAVNNSDKYGDIQVLIPESKVVMALADTKYKVKATDSWGNLLKDLIYHYSFGDGGESSGLAEVNYHYTYPGEYLLIASADGFSSGAKAEMKVKVIPPELEIKSVGGDKGENYIDIQNNSNYDLYLSNFYLRIDGKDYKLPEDLLLAKDKMTHLSGEAIGFKLPAKSVSLLYPDKTILRNFDFNQEFNINNSSSTQGISTNTVSLINSSRSENISNVSKSLNNLENSKDVKIIVRGERGLKKDISKDNLTKSINLIIKRLILDKDNIKFSKINDLDKISQQNSKVKEIDERGENYGKVDTGIIKWFKNLLY